VQAEHDGWRPSIHLSSVTYTYPTGTRPAVADLSLSVPAGSSLALVGRSGSGKSTLVDLILGVLTPKSGEIRLGGDVPAQALADYPGAIAYVPQQVVLSNSSVKSNVALGLPTDLVSDQDVWRALEMAHLAEAIKSLPDQLEARVGESGVRLSGGQRQRLGIARALLTKPRLLVLDEATSALDAETEEAISSMLAELRGDITMVIVAHRLSTVRGADQVAYLSEGRLEAIGTFAEVRLAVPALEKQAQLMGLSD
jgi:ABC-type multidrug transport system fused ATPase/permease subunit